jgi:hypothetical protein
VTGTITALTPGTSYVITGRAINSIGGGTASSPLTIGTLPAPAGTPTVTRGTASATVSWTASSTSTVTGYTVYADPGPATCTTTSINETSCVIGATAGVDYTYTVIAHAPGADSAASSPSVAASAAEPAVPASAPTDAPSTLSTTKGALSSINPSQHVIVVGTGFLPYSSISVILYSSPIVLGTAVTDGSGDFSQPVTMPATLAAGDHNIVASGVDRAGTTRLIRMPVTYTPTATPTAGTPTAGTPTSESLADTGAHAARQAIWATATIMIGGLLLGFARRRNRSGYDPA